MKNYEQVYAVIKFVWENDLYDEVMFRTGDDQYNAPREAIFALARCNDFFYWGSADCEELEAEDLPEALKALQDCEAQKTYSGTSYGLKLWICRKRKLRPMDAQYDNIDPELHVLFDACGPERDRDQLNHPGKKFKTWEPKK